MKMKLEGQLAAMTKSKIEVFECKHCGCIYHNAFSSDEDAEVCLWCSGEDQ